MGAVRARPPVIRISNGTFYRHHPNAQHPHPNPPLFAGLNFELRSSTPSTPSSSSTSPSTSPHNWCVVGPSLSGKTTLLQILRGQHLCLPPTARSYPFLATDAVPHRLRSAHKAVQYVGFDGEQTGLGLGGGSGPATSAYLAARYESRREKTDFSLRDFLLGNTQLNPLEPTPGGGDGEGGITPALLDRIVADLRLGALLDLPVAFLSNGQGRRARIARALLSTPEVLLLDEPFMGLDPPTVTALSPILGSLADRASPRLVLSARPQDPLPEWITHVAYLRGDCTVGAIGPRGEVLDALREYVRGVWKGGLKEDERMPVRLMLEMGKTLTADGIEGTTLMGEAENDGRSDQASRQDLGTSTETELGEPLVEMDGCQVKYGSKVALGNWSQKTPAGMKDGLIWTVRRGERWGIFGPNGSGKTTIVSLLCSDHPQTYSLPIKLFGQSRLPDAASRLPPLTFWDIQSRIGHSSPEVHQHMPRGLTVRQVVENAWADTFRSRARLDDEARGKVEAALRWFAAELDPSRGRTKAAASSLSEGGATATAEDGEGCDGDLAWASEYLFGELSFSAQRVALFVRAVIKGADVVVLDEAFSGMDDSVRDKCTMFLAKGEERTRTANGETVDSEAKREGKVKVRGLSSRQALICISHVKEEVPDCVREWICLPEANSTQPARFGRLDGPLRTDERRWREIWSI